MKFIESYITLKKLLMRYYKVNKLWCYIIIHYDLL